MLTKISFQKNKITGRLLLLPVLVALAAVFAFKNDWRSDMLAHPLKKIKIVLDPGHGRANGGATVNGIHEEDFNLMLAKKIREVAKAYDVDILLTREGDNTPEPEQTLRSSLEYRAKFAADQHADAFISIHMNSNESDSEKKSGFEIYISNKADKGSDQYKQSVKLGSSLSTALAKDYKTSSELIQRDKGILILDQAKVPAVLLECGSMDVKEDMEFMNSPANQEKIARDIIEGVLKFTSASISYVDPKAVVHGPDPGFSKNEESVEASPVVAGNSNAQTIDTITMEQMEKLDPGAIARVDVTKTPTDKKMLVTMKNGDQHFVSVIKEIKFVSQPTPGVNKDEIKFALDSNPALKKVEVESVYPGGITAWQNYLQKTLHYPDSAVNREIQGIVLTEFIVRNDGSIDPADIKVISGPQELRAESIRVIKESGKWIPAKDHGVAVNAYKIQPINYKLERQ